MLNPLFSNRRQFSLAVAATLAGTGRWARAQADGPIVLGQSAALSGPAAQLGLQFQQGAKLWFDKVNAQGGIGRRMIELRTLDDGYEPERCAANTRKFIADEVLSLFGYIGTPTSLAALPLFNQAQVPFFAPFTGAEALREPFNRLIFHVRASYFDETEVMVRQLLNLGIDRIAVFHQDDAYGNAGLQGVERALAQRSLKPVATATVARNSAEVGPAVKKLAGSQAGAIIQISTYTASAAFIRAARKAGYGGLFYNVSFVGTQALSDALGKEAEGVVVSQVMPSPYQRARPLTRDFATDVEKSATKVQANYSSLEGYLAARIFTEGLRNAQSSGRITRESLIAGLEAVNTRVGGSGFSTVFSAGNHRGSNFVEMSMLTGDGRVRA